MDNTTGHDSELSFNGMEIAVVGMAGRFPGAENISQFWDNLRQGKESITFFTAGQLLHAGIHPHLLSRSNYVKARAKIDRIEYFDASFFGYTPTEAVVMDPQLRFLHHCCWEALEDAACVPSGTGGSIGVYIGVGDNFEWRKRAAGLIDSGAAGDAFSANLLVLKDLFSTHISYRLNLTGPSSVISASCSTSLVAVHNACRGLLGGECDVALAGGVFIYVPQETGYLYHEGMLQSPDGHCRAFDQNAAGTVTGSGAGIVALKRLEDALEDGSAIYAVIKASSVNNDGRRKIGYTAPSVEGQAEAVSIACQLAEVDPRSISFIETHGTGTPLGDSLEIKALAANMDTIPGGNSSHTDSRRIAVGSVKTNIGHLDSASGIAGFIKTVLVLVNRLIPPTLHFNAAHPEIRMQDTPFYVNTSAVELGEPRHTPNIPPLRAAVNAFGIGGANAHVILEESPLNRLNNEQHIKPVLFLLSARTETALLRMAANLCDYIRREPGVSLEKIAYTLQTGRTFFSRRLYFTCSTLSQAVERLSNPTAAPVRRNSGGQTGTQAEPRVPSPHIKQLIEQEEPVFDPNAAGRILPGDSGDYTAHYDTLLTALGEMWLDKQDINWRALYGDSPPGLLHLPTYPFESKHYWPDFPFDQDSQTGKQHPGDANRGQSAQAVDIPLHPRPELRTPYAEPRNRTEKRLAEIWKQFFGLQQVGIDDQFYDLGGDSLKAGIVINRIHRDLGIRIPLKRFLQHAAIRELAKNIENLPVSIEDHVEPGEMREYYPLSFNQKRLWFIQTMEPANPAYNISQYSVLEGSINRDVISRVIQSLIARHEAFRTRFLQVGEEIVQQVLPADLINIPFNIVDLGVSAPHLTTGQQWLEVRRIHKQETLQPFNLDTVPLFRICAVKLHHECLVLMFTMHHIISDGWSLQVLKKEFNYLYNQSHNYLSHNYQFHNRRSVELPALDIQYRDFALRQDRLFNSTGTPGDSFDYWKQKIESGLIPTAVPADFQEENRNNPSAGYRIVITGDTHGGLLDLAAGSRVSVFTLLTGLFGLLLARVTGKTDIVYAALGAGRSDGALQDVVGFFVNTLLIKHNIDFDQSFPGYLKTFNGEVLGVLQHQDYPLELAYQKLQLKYPDIPLLFNMLNLDLDSQTSGSERKTPEPGHTESVPEAKFDMTLQASGLTNGIEILCFYRVNRYKKETVEYFMNQLDQLIDKIVSNPEHPIKHYLYEKKKRKLALP